MKEQFDTFKQEFLSTTLNYLWNQWAVLGAAGAGEIVDMGLVDPEALILLSVSLSENDLRLADEMLTWLVANGWLINTKRLLNLLSRYEFPVRRKLAGMAEYVSARNENWKRLTMIDDVSEEEQYSGTVKLPKSHQDSKFAKHGVFRPIYKNRGLSSRFDFSQKNALLLRLRSLLGMNVHCEILCYYADGRSIHASKAARDLGYSQKSIQETLASMEKADGVSSYQEGKNRNYTINLRLWQSLIPAKVSWKNPIIRYAQIRDVILLLSEIDGKYHAETDTALIVALIKNQYLRWKKTYPQIYETRLENESGERFLLEWMEWARK